MAHVIRCLLIVALSSVTKISFAQEPFKIKATDPWQRKLTVTEGNYAELMCTVNYKYQTCKWTHNKDENVCEWTFVGTHFNSKTGNMTRVHCNDTRLTFHGLHFYHQCGLRLQGVALQDMGLWSCQLSKFSLRQTALESLTGLDKRTKVNATFDLIVLPKPTTTATTTTTTSFSSIVDYNINQTQTHRRTFNPSHLGVILALSIVAIVLGVVSYFLYHFVNWQHVCSAIDSTHADELKEGSQKM